ncbi:MAG: M15 family metallopeptidase [Saprospiraceae bacterium]|nr:M15 family metallopeptidase [Saprospiraceae bacterium]
MKIIFFATIFGLLFSCWGEKKTLALPTTTTPVEVKINTPKPIEYEITPIKSIDYDTTQWLELMDLDGSIVLDLRYATEDNFVKTKMYDCPRCFLRPVAAKALVKAHQYLQTKGYGLKMFDCYRPRPIQWKLWEKVPDTRYVADPKKGSMHNRGAAVDLTIIDANGKELDMGTGFDFFGKEAYHEYTKLPTQVLQNRKLLKETMETFGFGAIRTEWWHYSYRAKSFELSDMLWKCPTE